MCVYVIERALFQRWNLKQWRMRGEGDKYKKPKNLKAR